MPKETRPYLVNITTKQVHSTANSTKFCQPDPSDNIGYADEGKLESLALEQGLIPCAFCLRDEADAILASI